MRVATQEEIDSINSGGTIMTSLGRPKKSTKDTQPSSDSTEQMKSQTKEKQLKDIKQVISEHFSEKS